MVGFGSTVRRLACDLIGQRTGGIENIRVDSASQRLARALESADPAAEVPALARVLRDEGMTQLAMYRLFAAEQKRLPGDDRRHNPVVDTMDLIWGGPWAEGRALFDAELTDVQIHVEPSYSRMRVRGVSQTRLNDATEFGAALPHRWRDA